MSGTEDVSLLIAFAAGLLSFLSPCVLPLVPSYVAFITGLSFEELTHEHPKQKLRRIILTHSLLFILGFSSLFTALGASASLLGQFLSEHRDTIRIAGGIMIILFGLFISGLLPLSFLQREKKFHLPHKPIGFLGTFFVGVTFAAGWTPCVGPILSSILLYASTSENMFSGVLLLLSYSLGLGIPFFACSLALNTFLSAFRKARRYIGVFTKIGGILLVLVGVLLLTNSLEVLNAWLNSLFPS